MKSHELNVGKQDPEYAREREAVELMDMLPEHEVKKTPEHLAWIKKAGEIVSETLANMGIENDFSADPEKVLIAKGGMVETMTDDETEKTSLNLGEGRAFHKIIGGNIILSDGLLSDKEAFMHALIHECFHSASVNYGFLTKENESFDARLIGKSGLASYYDSQSESKQQFSGWNEAITEELARDGLKRHFEELFPEKDRSESEKEWEKTYPLERRALYAVILNMSGGDDAAINSLWKEFVRNYVDGSVMSLRKIEKFYGDGALELLSKMTPAHDAKTLVRNKRILAFFSESDPEKRKSIKSEILRGDK